MTDETQVKTPKEAIQVKMDDGSTVTFAGKRKMLKSHTINAESGEVVVRMDFVNGEVRTYNIVSALLGKFAAHGAEQKLGDEIAGIEDVEDAVAAIDQLLIRLEKGEWAAKRESNGMSGVSVLAKALIELTGKSKDAINEFLSAKTHAEKIALRGNPKLKVIIDRLEADKVVKKDTKPQIDSDALLGALGA